MRVYESRMLLTSPRQRTRRRLRFRRRSTRASVGFFSRRRRVLRLREGVGGFVVAVFDAGEHVVVAADDASATPFLVPL